jgi:glycosyltransferase involved in cell wall biosynthesis
MNRRRRRHSLIVDVSTLLDDHWTGIPVFTRRLITALLRRGDVELDFVCSSTLIPHDCVLEAIRAGTGVVLHEFRMSRAPSRRRELAKSGTPLLFPSVKRACRQAVREASTVHDLSTLLMPDTHLDANVRHHLEHFSQELRTNEVVFCASEATQAALLTVLPSVSTKTRLLRQYVDWPEEFAALDQNLPRPKIGRYALVIGTIEPRKNLSLLLDSLGNPRIAESDINFVVVGRAGWKTEHLLSELTPAERERIRFTGFVSEFVKYRLLRHCEFLVYPSLYEGFGIPALEAMSVGKPVLAARTSSFPEVIDKAGLYFDPLCISEFAAAFAEMSEPGRLTELARRALKQSAKFTWQSMAAPVVEWVRA